jgi:serine/threonine protein kinase
MPKPGIRWETSGSSLGSGHFGKVYRAVDPDTKRDVGIVKIRKRGSSQAPADFRFEARVGCTVLHPNLCEGIDFGTAGEGAWFFLMERAPGEDLYEIAKRHGRLTVETTIELGRQIAAGLAKLHDAKIIHRDIKPENIIAHVSQAGTKRGDLKIHSCKIIDYGLCVGSDERGQLHKACGTFEYGGAPEVFTDTGWRFRSDVYALGWTLYALFMGSIPKDRCTDDECDLARYPSLKFGAYLRSPQQLQFQQLLEKMLKRDYKDRPHASEVKLELAKLLTVGQTAAVQQPQRQVYQQPQRQVYQQPQRQEYRAPPREVNQTPQDEVYYQTAQPSRKIERSRRRRRRDEVYEPETAARPSGMNAIVMNYGFGASQLDLLVPRRKR